MKKSMWKKLMSTILALVMVLGLSGSVDLIADIVVELTKEEIEDAIKIRKK